MRTKLIPTDWIVYRGRLRPEFPTVITEIRDANGEVIVKWQGFDGIKKRDVIRNARLLAAAPILLQALQDIIAECPNPKRPYGQKIVEIAEAAIKKAEGDSK